MLRETINKHTDQYFEAGKATEELGKRLLRHDELLAIIASFVHLQVMGAITTDGGSVYSAWRA